MFRNCILLLLIVTTGSLGAQCIAGDCENGNGTYKLPNGDMYTGNWVNGNREGYGRYDWANGSYYVGEFKNNMLNGKGAFYGVDGKEMNGNFVDNNFAGAEKDSTQTQYYDPNAGTRLEWLEIKKQDSIARATTLQKAQRVDFCTLVQNLTKDYANQFVSYLGERQEIVLSRNMNWYATIMAEGSVEAGVTQEKQKAERAYYNILLETTDSATAMQTYQQYITQLKACDNGCCTMVYDTYNYTKATHKSYSTSWATVSVEDGIEPLLYNSMIMELECMTRVGQPGWLVVFRMYDAKMLEQK